MAEKFNPGAFLDRLKEAFDGISVEKISIEIGVAKQSVYKWGRGETQPEAERLLLISRKTGCSIHWLLTGEGPKAVESVEEIEILKRDVGQLKNDAVTEFLIKQLRELLNRDELKKKVG